MRRQQRRSVGRHLPYASGIIEGTRARTEEVGGHLSRTLARRLLDIALHVVREVVEEVAAVVVEQETMGHLGPRSME